LKFGKYKNGSHYKNHHARTQVRLSAGRMNMSREGKLCAFFAANSILQEINY
jgi:biotin synthase-like enzyme